MYEGATRLGIICFAVKVALRDSEGNRGVVKPGVRLERGRGEEVEERKREKMKKTQSSRGRRRRGDEMW